jgi:hypothetical protein
MLATQDRAISASLGTNWPHNLSGQGFANRSQRIINGMGRSLANGCIGSRNPWPMELDCDLDQRELVSLELDDHAMRK